MQGDHHIVCSAISRCARWAAFSDVQHIRLFKLNMVSADGKFLALFSATGSSDCIGLTVCAKYSYD